MRWDMLSSAVLSIRYTKNVYCMRDLAVILLENIGELKGGLYQIEWRNWISEALKGTKFLLHHSKIILGRMSMSYGIQHWADDVQEMLHHILNEASYIRPMTQPLSHTWKICVCCSLDEDPLPSSRRPPLPMLRSVCKVSLMLWLAWVLAKSSYSSSCSGLSSQ